MIVTLRFHGEGKQTIEIIAQSDAEKAILAFMAENSQRKWKVARPYSYRPGAVNAVELVELPDEETPYFERDNQ